MRRLWKKSFIIEDGKKIKNTRISLSLCAFYFSIFFLVSGIHTGLIVGLNELNLDGAVKTLIVIGYWLLISAGFTLYTRKMMRDTFEQPLQRISAATRKVAKGDFSIYIPTLHTPDRLDYLDRMILDLNQMIEELGSVETLKTDFVSNVSHEMKTPIAVIKNAAQLLEKENALNAEEREYLAVISDASDRLAAMISNILKLNKLENQKIVPKAESYDICRQICDCVLQYESQWEKKQIEMELDLEESAYIQADPELLSLVWNNLLSNAFKFTEPGGTVSVRQTSAEGKISVSVSDTGCGMSEETIKRVFDKFYQGNTAHAREGNGLGLALVYRVLQLFAGEITIRSEEGKGSTFTVTLPLA